MGFYSVPLFMQMIERNLKYFRYFFMPFFFLQEKNCKIAAVTTVNLLYARHEKSVAKRSGRRGTDYCACAFRLFLFQTHCSPTVQGILYTNSLAGVDACFVKEYSVAVRAHPTPSRLIVAHSQYLNTKHFLIYLWFILRRCQ
jgi:hypothetical protein